MKNRTVNKQKLKRTQASLAVRRAVQDHAVDIAQKNQRRRSTDSKTAEITLESLRNNSKFKSVKPTVIPTKRSFWTRLKDGFMGLFGKGGY